MLRYVLLRHDCPPEYRDGPHWDLMLEREGASDEHRLATWSLTSLPLDWVGLLGIDPADAAADCEALQLADHRAAYLDYEGPIGPGPSGEARGAVTRLDRGGLLWVEQSADRVVVQLGSDGLLTGSLELSATPGAGGVWRLLWRRG